MKSYEEFLESKVVKAPVSGIDVSEADISAALKPHQRDAVLWALRGGRRALFEAFGLGKSVQQLEWCRVLTEKEGGQALIVCPLGVKQEFAHDAETLLHIVPPVYVRNMEEIRKAKAPILITNYERIRDGDIDPRTDFITALSALFKPTGAQVIHTWISAAAHSTEEAFTVDGYAIPIGMHSQALLEALGYDFDAMRPALPDDRLITMNGILSAASSEHSPFSRQHSLESETTRDLVLFQI